MLEELYVKDYVLFDKATIDFTHGMSVITGETGAGKSLLIDAISLLSGQRVSGNVVRSGMHKTVLQMSLSNINEDIRQLLLDNDYDVEDILMIQRTITDQGKSMMKINGQPATLSFVKTIVSRMIDVHSQMDTYQLMDPSVQLDLLDSYAKNDNLSNEVKEKYEILTKTRQALKKAKEQTYSNEALELATHQYNEIEDAAIGENELELLSSKIKELSKSQQLQEDLNQSVYALEKENGILDQIYQLNRILKKLDNTLMITNIYDQLYDLQETLKEKRDALQRDLEDIDTLIEREHQIKRLYRKYGGSYASMMEEKDRFLTVIDSIIHRQALLERLEKEHEDALLAYDKSADQLSQARKKVFDVLAKQLETHFHDLMLEKARFRIDCQKKEPSVNGIDDIQFLVSMNPGQNFSPLKQSASGGELSRLMLALKVVFQSQKGINTIIFDEIDTGVSGKVAFAMGQKMKKLANDYQVLCITHLSSVAAWADQHYHVSKTSIGKDTITHVNELDQNSMIEELAIMSHGKATTSSIEAAKELKERVHSNG